MKNASFQFCDFRESDLSLADFSGSDLTNSSFEGADLNGIILSKATIEGCDFYSAENLSKEAFYSTFSYQVGDLEDINLSLDLSGWDFSGKNLKGSRFYDANLDGVSFDGADLQDCYFGTSLENVRFSNAEIAGATFLGEYLYEGKSLNIEQLVSTAGYKTGNLIDLTLSGSELRGIDLSGVDLSNGYFRKVNFRDADFSHADLNEAEFYMSELDHADFSGAMLRNAQFANHDLSTVNFEKSDVSYGDFRGAALPDEFERKISSETQWYIPSDGVFHESIVVPEGDELLLRGWRRNSYSFNPDRGISPMSVNGDFTAMPGSTIETVSKLTKLDAENVNLYGTLSVAGDLDISGNVNIGDGINRAVNNIVSADFTVSGDYVLNPLSVLSLSGYLRLDISGSLQLHEKSLIRLEENIDSSSKIRFNDLENSLFEAELVSANPLFKFSGTLVESENQWSDYHYAYEFEKEKLKLSAFAPKGITEDLVRMIDTAANLEALPEQLMQELDDALEPEVAEQVLRKMTPEAADAVRLSTLSGIHSFNSSLWQLTDDGSAGSLKLSGYNGFGGLQLADSGTDSEVVADAVAATKAGTASVSGWTLSGNLYGMYADRDTASDHRGYRVSAGGAIVALDHAFNQRFHSGLACGYNEGNTEFKDSAGSAQTEAFRLGPYFGGSFSNWNFGGALTLGVNTVEQSRKLNSGDELESDYKAFDASLYSTIGYSFYPERDQTFSLKPSLSLEYIHYHQENYTEEGGSAALDVDARSFDSLQTVLGLQLRKEILTRKGKLVPEVFLGWRHEFLEPDSTMLSHFVSTGDSFKVKPAGEEKNHYILGLGLEIVPDEFHSFALRFESMVSAETELYLLDVSYSWNF